MDGSQPRAGHTTREKVSNPTTYRPGDPGWEAGQALANAAFKDPECLRGFVAIAMLQSRAADVIARPGLPGKITALGAGWRDEPIPAPSRAELLSTVAGD